MAAFRIHQRPRLTLFLALSLCIHLLFLLIQNLMPPSEPEYPKMEPVKVKFIDPAPLAPSDETTFIEGPEPEMIEVAESELLTSKFVNAGHSGRGPVKKKVYQRPKSKAPKSSEQTSKVKSKKTPKLSTKRKTLKLKKVAQKKNFPRLKKPKKTLPKSKRRQKVDIAEPSSKSFKGPGLMSMLDGFDASKYASIETDFPEAEDDDEPISLNTRETKYADYFARIKHQIEQVWTYPSEAARLGISGEITLRFRISKDGNLLGIRLVDSSGTEVLDKAALKAVKRAAPYYPFPVTITKDKITILATFIYSPTYSSTIYPSQDSP